VVEIAYSIVSFAIGEAAITGGNPALRVYSSRKNRVASSRSRCRRVTQRPLTMASNRGILKTYNVVAAVLVITAAGLFVAANSDEVLGQFWLILAIVSIVAALLAWITPRYGSRNSLLSPHASEFGVLPSLSNPQRARRIYGITFSISTILAVAAVLLLHWESHADFDVIGILWLMQNALPLVIVIALLSVVLGSFLSWRRSFKKPQ
jgi:hypothetical protein